MSPVVAPVATKGSANCAWGGRRCHVSSAVFFTEVMNGLRKSTSTCTACEALLMGAYSQGSSLKGPLLASRVPTRQEGSPFASFLKKGRHQGCTWHLPPRHLDCFGTLLHALDPSLGVAVEVSGCVLPLLAPICPEWGRFPCWARRHFTCCERRESNT